MILILALYKIMMLILTLRDNDFNSSSIQDNDVNS